MTTTTLANPFVKAAAPTNAARDKIEKAYRAGKKARAEYEAELARLRDERFRALEAVEPTEDAVEHLDAIRDLTDRAEAAEALRRAARARMKQARDRRNLAAFVLIQPFTKAVGPTNSLRKAAKREWHAGKMTTADYYARLDELVIERHAALEAAGVTVEPADVYKPMGVSRAALIEMIEDLPEQLPKLRNPDQALLDARADVDRYTAIEAAARNVRNRAVDRLLHGDGTTTTMSNADVARITRLTTARIAQLRKGTR